MKIIKLIAKKIVKEGYILEKKRSQRRMYKPKEIKK